MKLFDYYRSTASYRVRMALNVKGLDYTKHEVHLVNRGGEQLLEDYSSINPSQLVPSLEVNEGVISQSIAVIEYIDEVYPIPPLLPKTPFEKALVRSLAFDIACDIHPLNNLRVLKYLKQELEVSEDEKLAWYQHWVSKGFHAIEKKLLRLNRTKPVCFGDTLSIADLCLVAQVYNANRFECPMSGYPTINEINDYCLTFEAIAKASPDV